MTVPQLRAMYNGDQARKQTLVEHGFRVGLAAQPQWRDTRAVAAMGRETRERLEEYGVHVSLVPERADAESMLRLLVSKVEEI